VTVAAQSHDWYLVGCAAGTVLLLLVLIATRLRLHPALALCIAAVGLGVASGMPLAKVPLAFTAGVANLMGHIAIILGLGAILGRLLASSGGAAALGRALVDGCGKAGLPWALLALGVIVGMPVFFEVGLVLMMPIVAEAARRSGKPPIVAGMPLLAGLSIAHGMLPPHPAAMLAATEYHADVGRTILWGLVAGVPAAALTGLGFGQLLTRQWEKRTAKNAARGVPVAADEALTLFAPTLAEDLAMERRAAGAGAGKTMKIPAPSGALRAASAILLPIAIIFLGSWADTLTTPGSGLNAVLHFAGYPDIALLIAVLVALGTLGPHLQTGREHGPEMLRKLISESFEPIANVLVILAAAGGLSGVLRESGAAQATVDLALGAHMPPLVLAWMLAAVVRIAMGSATVATAVAAGILAPMVGHLGVRPEMLVLATGAGSLICSHVNDPGFWTVQSFFKMEVKDMLKTWTVMETVLSIAGLGTTLALAAVLR